MKRKLKLAALVLSLGFAVSVNAQKTQPVEVSKDKKKIELRPNSLDYGAVRRDNVGARVDRVKNKDLYVKKRPANRQHVDRNGTKRDLKRDQRLQRKQRLIQRRALNR